MSENIRLEYWEIDELHAELLKNFTSLPNLRGFELERSAQSIIGDWSVKENGIWIASFSLERIPHSQILISYASLVATSHRNRGIGTALNQLRQLAVRAAGWSGLIATVNLNNEYERKLLAKTGWTGIGARFGNEKLYYKSLKE